VDALIFAFQQLVHDPSVRLDWTTFGRNQALYVCLKARRPDEALQILHDMQDATSCDGKSYLQPNVNTYNTVLQTLSLDGRVEEIHRILTHLVETYRQAQTSTASYFQPRDRSARSASTTVHANHMSVMPWLTAHGRLPLDHVQRLHAGHHAEAAVQWVQTWAADGLVDCSAFKMDLATAAVAKAWLHSESPETLTRLLALWQNAVQTDHRGISSEAMAVPRLAWTVVSALNDGAADPSVVTAMASFWRDTEALTCRSRGTARQAWLRWHQRVVRTLFAAGDVADGHVRLQVLQRLDPKAAAVVEHELAAALGSGSAHALDSKEQP
jgi:pentatricopeptide repeat protein